MKVRIAKKATKGKGKQWRRGQSSSCNPETKKFRSKSKSILSEEDRAKSSQLTLGAIESHNLLQLENFSLSDDDTKSEAASFASLWSNCTNSSFEKLLSKWQPNSVLHREMLAVLATATEIIKEKGGKETETEYFAVLVTSLNAVNSNEALTATVCLLHLVVKRLPQPVLKAQFSETSQLLRGYLKKFVDSDNGALMRSLIGCLAVFLRAQEAAVWNLSSTQQAFGDLLSLTTHNKPRVRKAAHRAVVGILKGSSIVVSKNVTVHPGAPVCADFCVRTIEETRPGDSINAALHMLNLMKDIVPLLPQKQMKTACETVLRTMSLGNVLILSCCLQAFHELFVKAIDSECLTTELNTKLILALCDFQPNVNDAQPMSAWLAVIKQAYVSLFSTKDGFPKLKYISKLLQIATACWRSEIPSVHTAVEDCLRTVIEKCVKPMANEVTTEAVGQIVLQLQECLSYKYMNAWGSLLKVLTTVFETFGEKHAMAFSDLLKSVGEMRNSEQFRFQEQLDAALRIAVKSMGPKTVLKCIPVAYDTESDSLTNSWLLSVLRTGIEASEISFFVEYFIPLHKQIEENIVKLQKKGNITQTKVLSFTKLSIWELLPAFFLNAKDLTTSFKNVARALGDVLTKNVEVRPSVLKALRVAITSNPTDEAKAELAKYAKNFLPIFLRLYTAVSLVKTNEERLLVLETLKAYLSITTKEVFQEQFTNLQKNLNTLKTSSEQADLERKHALLDILCAFIPYMSSENHRFVYKEYTLYCINGGTDRKCQKKGYKTLEVLIKSSNDPLFVEELLQVLRNSIPGLISSMRYAPLRSITFILEQNLITNEEQRLELFSWALKEAIRSLTIISAKTKTAAEELLVVLAKAAEAGPSRLLAEITKDFEKYDKEMQASAVHALSVLLNNFGDSLSREEKVDLVKFIVKCLRTENRALIRSVIAFVKSWLKSLAKEESFHYVGAIVSSLTSLPDSEKAYFRFKIKEVLTTLVRKFGFESISKLVPESYSKILKSIRKIESKKTSKSSEETDEAGKTTKSSGRGDESSEDELEVTDAPERGPRKKRLRLQTYIAEGDEGESVVDLLSAEANQKIFSINPSNNESAVKSTDFEMAEDGRLIIELEDEKKQKGTKRKRDQDEDEEEERDDDRSDKDMEEVDAHNVKKESISREYRPGGRGIHRKVKDSDETPSGLGAEYRSTKARGDMKRKGRPDPFAYVPLNREALSKKKQAKFRGQFRNIVSAARKGAAAGHRKRGKPRKN